jgi:hypothetical protein
MQTEGSRLAVARGDGMALARRAVRYVRGEMFDATAFDRGTVAHLDP